MHALIGSVARDGEHCAEVRTLRHTRGPIVCTAPGVAVHFWDESLASARRLGWGGRQCSLQERRVPGWADRAVAKRPARGSAGRSAGHIPGSRANARMLIRGARTPVCATERIIASLMVWACVCDRSVTFAGTEWAAPHAGSSSRHSSARAQCATKATLRSASTRIRRQNTSAKLSPP